MVSNISIHPQMAWARLTQSCRAFYRQHHYVTHGYTHVDLSILSRGHNSLENTRATPRSVCHHHRHGIHLHDVLTHVVSIIITIIIIHPSHMAWERPTWSCRSITSPELHMLSHDHPDHIMSNTITTIQVLDYATRVLDCLTGVATT